MVGAPAKRICFVTLFPKQVQTLAEFGVLGRAAARGILAFDALDPRDFTEDLHRTVDDRPYGGGPGMVMKVGPLQRAVRAARERMPAASPCVVMSAQGRVLDQELVVELGSCPGLIIVAGRYEGPDERLIELEAQYEVSVGDYVLSGGELPALTLADAVARLEPGVLGDADSAAQDSFADGLLDCPHYTRPEVYAGHGVPEVLLSGDHGAIRRWRLKQALGRTWTRRPDLLGRLTLDAEQRELLDEYIAEAGEDRTGWK
jgi:tRNA (guanine37-N1)-methyltransferase